MAKLRKEGGCPYCGRSHGPEATVCPMTGMSLRFADPETAIGQVVGGKYRLLRLLGRGGMGTVYEAVNTTIDKRVAIKILLPESANIDQVVERFRREARSAATIGHENIVDIYDLDTTEDGVVYIVMELLAGSDLANVLASCRFLPLDRAATVGAQTARALGAAHERGIIHRDLKPENIFIVRRKSGETVKIVDFGIAMIKEHGALSRLTTDGILLGTPFYMSPEQARGVRELDYRVDIYALGAVLFEVLTGTVLFTGDTYLEVISKHQIETPPILCERKPDLACPPEVADLIYRMLSKDPARRPSSMEEVERVLLPWSLERPSHHAISGDYDNEHARTSSYEKKEQAGAGTEALMTTPVQWDGGEEKKKTGAWSARRKLLVGGAALLLFAASAAAAMLLMDGGGAKKGARGKGAAIAAKTAAGGKPAAAAAAAAAGEITLDISASPAGAAIAVDGKPAAGNPARVTLPAAPEKKASVVVTAPGFASQAREVALDRSQAVSVTLVEEQVAPAKEKPRPPKGGEAAPAPPVDEAPAKKGKKSLSLSEESPYKPTTPQ